MTRSTALSLQGVSRRRGREADGFTLEVTSLEVAQGERVALTGPSGSGKSTLLDLLGLVLRPDECVSFRVRRADGELVDAGALWKAERTDALAAIRARTIGYVLQTGRLLPFLPAWENIVLPRSLLGMAEDPLVGELIERLGVGHLLARKPAALSVGERQRIGIARALAHRPALLLADEPTAALDPVHGLQVMELMLELTADLGATAIVVTHDLALVRTLGLREIRASPAVGGRGGVTRFEG